MHVRRRKLLTHTVTVVVAVVGVALVPSSAGVSEARVVSEQTARELSEAHVVRARSRVGIVYGRRTKRFFGRVRSPARVCRAGRIVRLIRARRRISDELVGTARTGRLGGWRLRVPGVRGRFYVKAIRKVRTPYGHFHRCRADVSRVIRVRRPRG
jgi:hypothetical protein